MLKRSLAIIMLVVAAAALGAASVLAVRARQRDPVVGRAGPGQAVATPGTSTKQLWTCGMHPQVIQDHPGNCPICHMKLTPLKTEDETGAGAGHVGEKKVAYWWDPMLGPSSISNHPGKSAMGMDMVPVYEDQVQGGPGVRIDPAVVQNMGVLTAPVVRGPLDVTVRAVGMLEVPQPAMHDVTLKINGYVQKLYADTDGMVVTKGQVLFDLYSPDLEVAAQELIGAEQALKALDAGAAPAVRADAERMVESAKRKLRLWDLADRDVEAIASAASAPQTVPFRSPADGHIVDKAVVAGSAVQQGQRLMRIEDHGTLWLDAQVYEDQVQAVKVGQDVRATIDGLPGRTFGGKVSFIYPHVDHMTRTELVRTTLANPEHELRPGMYATAEIVTRPVADAVLVPREAVIDTGTRQIAFVVDPALPGHFVPRNVRRGIAGDDDKVQVVEGLAPGDTVVTSGQFLMDVESRTTEAIQKLRGTGAAAAAPPRAQGEAEMMHAAPATSPTGAAAVAPTTGPAQLVVAHCPMKNVDWLQSGDAIANPYFGTSMPTCGSVTRRVVAPRSGSPLSAVTTAYLKVAQGLDADQLDATARAELKASADLLADPRYATLKGATTQLAAATTVDEARAALSGESAALAGALGDDSGGGK